MNNIDYSFFDSLYEFEEKNPGYQLYDPPYFLELKVKNYYDNNEITIKTDKVFLIKELPQNINEVVKKYNFIQNYIKTYNNNSYLLFDIKFFSELGSIDKIYYIQVIKLKEMM